MSDSFGTFADQPITKAGRIAKTRNLKRNNTTHTTIMKINGTNINEFPEQLAAMSCAIAALIEITDASVITPDIRAGNDLTEMRGVKGVFYSHKKGVVEGIFAGGTDISEIVSQSTWNACEEQAEQLYISETAERRTAAAQNNADIKSGK